MCCHRAQTVFGVIHLVVRDQFGIQDIVETQSQWTRRCTKLEHSLTYWPSVDLARKTSFAKRRQCLRTQTRPSRAMCFGCLGCCCCGNDVRRHRGHDHKRAKSIAGAQKRKTTGYVYDWYQCRFSADSCYFNFFASSFNLRVTVSRLEPNFLLVVVARALFPCA